MYLRIYGAFQCFLMILFVIVRTFNRVICRSYTIQSIIVSAVTVFLIVLLEKIILEGIKIKCVKTIYWLRVSGFNVYLGKRNPSVYCRKL